MANSRLGLRTRPGLLRSYTEGSTGGDADAFLFLTAAGITDITITSAIQQLVIDLKNYGLWTKMKAIYPFVGGTASSHRWNLRDPRAENAAFYLEFFGGWTHTSNGVQGNGTNGYIDTKVKPSTSLTTTSGHFSMYITTNVLGDMYDIGSFLSNNDFMIASRWTGNIFYSNYGATTYPNVSNSDSRGLFVTNRNSSTNTTGFKNNNKVIDAAQSVTLSSTNLTIAASFGVPAGANFSSRNYAFCSIGDGLTDTDVSNLYTTVQAFQTTLGRQV